MFRSPKPIMSERNIILNPYLSLESFKNQNQKDCLRFSSPVRSVGVRILEFDSEDQPSLYELFTELNQTSLNFLDVDEDLTDADKALLMANGILVHPDKVPQIPVFACFLDETLVANQIPVETDLVVNESFRYDKSQDFETVIKRRRYGFEARQPIVWVTDPKTKVNFPYWLSGELPEIAENLKAGEQPMIRLTDHQRAFLRQAEILIRSDSTVYSNWRQDLEAAAAHFQKEKYTVVRGILPSAQLAAIQKYFKELRRAGFMLFNDSQVSLRHAIHNDALSIYFHEQLAPLVSRVVGEPVKPSYVYSATYVEDAVLEAHTDRPQCEFTMSMQIGYEPELETGEVSPWALCLDDLRENRIETYLANGDALIYKGCELVHYRDALFKKHQSTSVFFHFVPENFDGPLD